MTGILGIRVERSTLHRQKFQGFGGKAIVGGWNMLQTEAVTVGYIPLLFTPHVKKDSYLDSATVLVLHQPWTPAFNI